MPPPRGRLLLLFFLHTPNQTPTAFLQQTLLLRMSLVIPTAVSLLRLYLVNKAAPHICLAQTLVYSAMPTAFAVFPCREANMPWRGPGTHGDILIHGHHLAELYLEACGRPPGTQHNPDTEWNRQRTSCLPALCSPPLKSTKPPSMLS